MKPFKLTHPLKILVAAVIVMWALEIVDILFLNQWLNRFGVIPRNLESLPCIFLMPFLHGGIGHLIANTVPMLVLGGMVIARKQKRFYSISLIIIALGGLGVWIMGPAYSVHIGASGLVFGYFGYLLASAYFERTWSSILVAILVMFIYGGVLWGLNPFQKGVSWMGHLFGLAAGAVAAVKRRG